jgi:adenosylcobinamide kinase/adenosylcobinamide-phosphate guanylyltransferase
MTRPLPFDGPHLVLGGARSGKSRYAESLIAALPPPYVYVATAEIRDHEMADRVAEHRSRRGDQWITIECPLELLQTLRRQCSAAHPVLVDCLTLWISNLLLDYGEAEALRHVDQLCELIPSLPFPLVLVSNEVGTGIVPENATARVFRDLAGRTNQRIAAACRTVSYLVAGIPLTIKESGGPFTAPEVPRPESDAPGTSR